MARLFDTGIFSVEDTDGSVGVGWKLYFYITGTSTLKNTYPTKADALAGTNANANPVVTAADGRWSAIWLTDGDYKVILKDADDVTLETRDPADTNLSLSDAAEATFSQATSFAAATVGKKLQQSIDPRDAPYSATGDGTTDDTASFTSLEGAHTGQTIDLRGLTYLVDAIPTANVYTNGYWKLTTDTIPILYPAAQTLSGDTGPVSDSGRYQGFCQDTAHQYQGRLYVGWSEGADHQDEALQVILASSVTGASYETEVASSTSTTARVSTCMGVMNGQQFMDVRLHNTGYTITDHQLFSRRLAERKEQTDGLATTSGTATVTVTWEDHGLKTGQNVQFTGVTAVGGLSPSGWRTVTRVDDDTFTVTETSNASSTASGGGSFAMETFEGDWTEITIGGVSLGNAIVASGVFSAIPTMIHSFTTDGSTIWIGASGNGYASICRITDPLGTPTLKVSEIQTSTTSLIEPSVKYSGGSLYGFLRTQSASLAPAFFYCDNPTAATPTFSTVSGGSEWNGFCERNAFPLAVHGSNIYAVSGPRVRDDGEAGDLPIYLLHASITDAKADWDNFTVTKIGSAYNSNAVFSNTSNGVGVGTMLVQDEKLIIYYGTERPGSYVPNFGAPTIEVLELPLFQVLRTQTDNAVFGADVPIAPKAARQTLYYVQGLLLPQTQKILEAFNRQPRRQRAFAIDDFVAAMIDADTWDKLDAFYCLAAHSEQASLINWRYPGLYTAVAENSPTFTADTGWAGNGTDAYLNTTASVHSLRRLTQNSSHVGAWVTDGTDAGDATKRSVGCANAALLNLVPWNGSNQLAGAVTSTSVSALGSASTVIGYSLLTRRGATEVEGYIAGVSNGTDTDASTTLTPSFITIFRNTSTYSDFTIPFVHFGSALSDTEAAAIDAALDTLGASIGCL